MPRPSPTSGVTVPWLIATVLWLLGVGTFTWLNLRQDTQHTICLLKNLTSIPCPGCGGTRAVLALTQGHVGEALSFNPLTTSLLLLSPLFLFAWIRNRKRQPADRWHPGRIFWIITLALVLANWCFVIQTLP